MITQREVKIAVAVWATITFWIWTLLGTPADPSVFHGQAAKLQSLMRVVN